MSKWFGKVGFGITIEKPENSGIYITELVEKEYMGDVITFRHNLESNDKINEDLKVTNVIDIVADPFAANNVHAIRYITFSGSKWKVTSVTVTYPRVRLTLGGVYNE